MAWFNEKGDMQDVVLSTRVRFARNLEGYPFTSRLDDKGASEIIEKVASALPDYKREEFSSISDKNACASYMEMHYVSPEFASADRRRALFSGGEGSAVRIMVCEEDHIRIQSIVAGFDPEHAYELAAKADDALSEKLNMAYSDKYGYLTHCPTNLGAAMRVSAMLCLPALTITRSIDEYTQIMNKMGLTIRGIYGEGTQSAGCLYQISNRASLGSGEEEIIKLMSDVIRNLVKAERQTREVLYDGSKLPLTDKISRTVGLLKNAYMLSSSEFNSVFSDLELGLSLGIISGIETEKLAEMLIAVQPATVSMSREGLENDDARDVRRAEIIRDMTAKIKVKYQ